MELAIQYLNDSACNIKAAQVSITEWKKVLAKLRKYEQMLKMKSDLTEAFEEVNTMGNPKQKSKH